VNLLLLLVLIFFSRQEFSKSGGSRTFVC